MTIACGVDRTARNVLAAEIGDPVSVLPDLEAIMRRLSVARGAALVVLGPELTVEQTLRYAARIRDARPSAIVVVLRPPMNRLERQSARDAGVSAVLPTGDLRAAARICREFLAARSAEGTGQLVTVFAGKGGSGTTTVAANLALALAQPAGRRIGLVDLDLRSGDVAMTLGLPSARTLVHGPVDTEAVDAMVTPYRPGLDCLLAPARPGVAERLEAEGVSALLSELVSRYDVVIVDTPASLTKPVVTALDCSEHHVLVTTPERPALQRLRAALDAMDLLGHPRDGRSVLLNRVHSGVGMTAQEVDGVLRAPVAGSIPWSGDVTASINRRTPLVESHPDHPVSVALRSFAVTLLTRSAAHPPSALGGAVT